MICNTDNIISLSKIIYTNNYEQTNSSNKLMNLLELKENKLITQFNSIKINKTNTLPLSKDKSYQKISRRKMFYLLKNN